MSKATRGRWPALACAALLALLLAAPVADAATEPVFSFYASEEAEGKAHAPYPSPGSGFDGPCGVGVDPKGNFYVSDYYHDSVDAFSFARANIAQLAKVDPLDGPCETAFDAAGRLYVNDYHRSVLRYTPSAFPLVTYSPYGVATAIEQGDESTGVAVDPVTGRIYIDDRTYIAVYEEDGTPVEVAGRPLHIGEGSLEDGYGLALSTFPLTSGYLYVPDAATDTVKVYDPATDAVNPVRELDGSGLPEGQFTSLRDAAVAVDRSTGEIYVADDLQPGAYERPEARIDVFDDTGAYRGHLKYDVVDALPVGLAVDNSATATQGYVYVTSGNTEGALVYAYTPNAATKAPPACAAGGTCTAQSAALAISASAPGRANTSAPAVFAAKGPPPAPRLRPGGQAAIVQRGNLRVTVNGKLSPERLPREGAAPIAVSISGQIATTDGAQPPQLKSLRIEINRHGSLDFQGLPSCPYNQIQPASSQRALSACGRSLVGKGTFSADIVLAGQEPYETEGKLLVFRGEKAGKPVLFGQIYAPRPFATSFVIVFSLSSLSHGTYGTALTARLPKALGNWGYVTGIQMRLARRFGYQRHSRSFLSAGCPAPKGISRVSFPLARTSFSFAGTGKLSSVLLRECRARG